MAEGKLQGSGAVVMLALENNFFTASCPRISRNTTAYASDIRRGRRRPHPRHWERLAKLGGVFARAVTGLSPFPSSEVILGLVRKTGIRLGCRGIPPLQRTKGGPPAK